MIYNLYQKKDGKYVGQIHDGLSYYFEPRKVEIQGKEHRVDGFIFVDENIQLKFSSGEWSKNYYIMPVGVSMPFSLTASGTETNEFGGVMIQ